jgi:hypothetical protein
MMSPMRSDMRTDRTNSEAKMTTLIVAVPPIRRTLSASPAMVEALHRTSVRQPVDKNPEKSPVVQPTPPSNEAAKINMAKPKPAAVEADPERKAAKLRRAALLATLTERWPQLFPVEGRAVPLAIGTGAEIAAQLTCDQGDLDLVMRDWCRRGRYQMALVRPGAVRTRLDGSISDAVTEKQQEQARLKLAKMKRRRELKEARKAADANG